MMDPYFWRINSPLELFLSQCQCDQEASPLDVHDLSGVSEWIHSGVKCELKDVNLGRAGNRESSFLLWSTGLDVNQSDSYKWSKAAVNGTQQYTKY